MTRDEVSKIADEVAKKFAEKGLLIEAGWMAMRTLALKDASDVQLHEMRKAFFCGAQHLFASILGILDPGAEPTDADLKKMDLIQRELDTFVKELANDIRRN